MILYRIASKAHARDLSGTGALLYGGRWNKKGISLLYTSESLSLAALEIVANLSSSKLNRDLNCVEIDFPDHLKITVPKKLPPKWNSYPYSSETVNMGSEFVEKDGLCLKVPSAIIPSESNYLLNPNHDDFEYIQLMDARPLILDSRLIKNVISEP